MDENKIYDAAVIGGGLAGLCYAVLLAKKGRSIILFEKEKYPFHKVCGEYISNESAHFLEKEIGVPLTHSGVSRINTLQVSSPNGNALRADLHNGGFGISRYKLDNIIKNIAEQYDVKIHDGTKADEINFEHEIFTVKTSTSTFKSKCCCGSWGKRSNFDIKWKRPFTLKNSRSLDNYIGIKYHIRGDLPDDLISLHNFRDGYCGISKIEDDKYCLCYFMKASNLKKSGNSIEQAEQTILSENPHLKKILENMTKLNEAPVTVAQVSLNKKSAVEDHVLMLGDAAGMISPLCGNGMSIAMHSAKLAAKETESFLGNIIGRKEMEMNYSAERKKYFGKRIAAGRLIQHLFDRKK